MNSNLKNKINIIQNIESKIFPEKNLFSCEFKKINDWIIKSSNGISPPFSFLKKIPGLSFKPSLKPSFYLKYIKKAYSNDGKYNKTKLINLLGPFWGWWFQNSFSAKIQASCIYTKRDNLVAFYIESGQKYIIKTGANSEQGKKVIQEAEKLRLINNNLDEIKINVNYPKIYEENTSGEFPFFIQEFIDGKDLNKNIIFRLEQKLTKISFWSEVFVQIINFLFSMFNKFSIQYKNLKKAWPKIFLKPNELAKKSKYLSDITIKKIFKLDNEACNLTKMDKLVPQSFCHGDISVHNIIIKNNKIYLIDWGNAGYKPIIEDFNNIIYLSRYNNKIMKKIINYIKQLKQGLYTFEEQMFFVNYNKLIKHLKNKKSEKLVNEQISICNKFV